jgi:hypothetical protein
MIKLISCENIPDIIEDYDIEDYFIDDNITKFMKKDNELLYNLRNIGLIDMHKEKEILHIFINLCENSKGLNKFVNDFNLLVGKCIYVYTCRLDKIEPLILTKIYSRKLFVDLCEYIKSKEISFHTRHREHILSYIRLNNISKYKIFY